MRAQENKPAQAPGGRLGSCGRGDAHSNLIPSLNKFKVFALVFTCLWWPDLIWLGPISYRIELMNSCKIINVWREVQFRNFIQPIMFVSVFSSIWWPDLIRLGSIFNGLGSIESSKLTNMWRHIKFHRFIQNIVFVSFFANLWWPYLIWLGSILHGIGCTES